ncbi:MAG TPA: hypothetical protein VGE92_00060 [Steroidobacteraceae bacterium]
MTPRNPLLKCTAFNGLLSVAALLPLMAAADSHLQSTAPGAALSAQAHVDFKIVIPEVLYLRSGAADKVSIMSNSRNVTLSATAPESAAHLGSHVILRASAGKVIAQDADCTLPKSRPVICTASMP